MESILRKLKLDYLIEKFITEKITPDLVGNLSLNEFKELETHNRNDIMAVRIECMTRESGQNYLSQIFW